MRPETGFERTATGRTVDLRAAFRTLALVPCAPEAGVDRSNEKRRLGDLMAAEASSCLITVCFSLVDGDGR